MKNFIKKTNKKLNGIIWSFISTGVILIILSILIVWTDFMLRLVVGLIVLVIAYAFLFVGLRVLTFKKEIDKFFRE
jgi:uncharacterized membrane protein